MRIETITLHQVRPAGSPGVLDAIAPYRLRTWELHRGVDYLIEAQSGRGKSSLCAFVYGLRSDYNGQILFDGKDAAKLKPRQWVDIRRRAIAYLPQEIALFGQLTVIENLRLKNSLTNFASEAQMRQMLEALDLGHKADWECRLLSIGQQQRVAIIRALLQPFSFLLLDEPVSHLDAQSNRAAAALISTHAKRQGASVVATSVGNRLLLDDFTELQL